MNAAGVTEVMYEGVNVGDKDFSALIAKMKEAGVTVVYWGGLHTEAGLIIRQLADQGLKATLMSGDGIVSNELASIAGDAVAGTLKTFASGSAQEPGGQGTRREVPRCRLRAGSLHALLLCRAAGLAAAANKAGANDAQEGRQGHEGSGPLPTALGDIGYDEKGDSTRPGYVMYEWKKGDDGKYTYVEMQVSRLTRLDPGCPARRAGRFLFRCAAPIFQSV